MSNNNDLKLALRIQADLDQARRELGQLNAELENTGSTAKEAAGDLGTLNTATNQLKKVGETAQQQAERIRTMVAASQEQRAALDAVTSSSQRNTASARETNAAWRETAAAQSAAMSAHVGVVSAEQKHVAALNSTSQAIRTNTISTGQYKQAMRQLPMQITDVTTSLASGMPLWLVAIQQGGQIKDSFGGVGNSAKALVSLITPMRLAIAGAAGVMAALGVAAYQAHQENEQLNRSLISTGNYAGTTAGDVRNLSQQWGESNGEIGKARDILTGLIGSGRVSGTALVDVGRAALAMSKLTGQGADEVVQQFSRMTGDAVRWATETDRQYHFLTAGQLAHIQALQTQGKEQEAAAEATRIFADVADERLKKINDNLPGIERGWNSLTSTIKNAWASLKDTLSDDPAKISERLQAQINARTEMLSRNGTPSAATLANDPFLKRWKEQKEIQDQFIEGEKLVARIDAENAAKDDKAKRALLDIESKRTQYLSQQQQKQEALNKLTQDYLDLYNGGKNKDLPQLKGVSFDGGKPSGGGYEVARQQIEQRFKPKADTTSRAEETTYAALNKQITERIAVLDAAAAAESKLSDAQKYSEGVQASLTLASTKLTAAQKEGIKARLADLGAADRNAQAKIDGKSLADVQTKLLAAQGQSAAVATAQIEKEYGDLIARLKVRGDQAGLDLVNKLINVEQAKARLDELQAQMDRAFSEQSSKENTIQAEQQAGLISEIGARREIIDLHKQTADEIEKLIPEMERLAIITGDPAAIERIKVLKAKLGDVKKEADGVAKILKSGFEDGLSGAIKGLAMGTMDLQDAALSFVQSIAGSMADLASQKIAAGATDGLANMFGSILETAPKAVTEIGTVATAKTVADTTMTASGATAAAASTATQTAAAAATTAAWTPASITASIGSWGAAAAIGLAAVVAALAFKAFADGGHVRGPGTTTSDSIPALLSDQEFVTRASVVTQPGALPFLNDFNRRGMAALGDWAHVVRHATGGLAGVPAPALPAPGAGRSRLAEPAKAMSANVSNRMRVYLLNNEDELAQRLSQHPALEKAVVAYAGQNGQAIRAEW